MSHPYKSIPDLQRWSRAMAGRANAEIDPVQSPPFRIEPNSRIVTAGSCFAQHVARHLLERGSACFETEPAHPLMPSAVAAAFNYGIYSARYGNVYTSRQLLQLWRRSTGVFMPLDDRWDQDGACFDPFRPTIQPDGFSSPREYAEDRRQHLAAVRQAFTEMDVFVFTLGLTECWASREDGAVYPLCPGVAAGCFDADRHELHSLTVDEVVADLRSFVTEVRQVNPRMKMILTVSPVPLAATARPHHVLAATTYSKSVLRVAAERLAELPDVYYFPAYEIIGAAGNDYFAADRRSILESGVRHVMALFFEHVLGGEPVPSGALEADDFLRRGQAIVDTLCDEQRLDSSTRDDGVQDLEWSDKMIEPERQQAVLAHARELMKRANYDEAINYLRQACREQPDGEYQKLLARCRHQAYVAQPPKSEHAGEWLTEVEDVFAEIDGIPEINAEQLTARTLVAGIRHHGALLVRGLLDPSRVTELVAGIDQALQSCQDWHDNPGEAPDTAWYSRLPLEEACAVAGGRDWGESAGGVLAGDSPRMLYELMELFEASGLLSTITDYFGEKPMLSVGKSTLRRVPATQGIADWHQDGAFMGSDIRSVNVWLSLSHCGEDASGLEILPRRVPVVLPTGTHGANFSWTVGPGMVEQTAAGVATVSPVFAPGDALLFDHFFLHRTGVPPGISKPRYAIESWFFAPSAYPAKQVPLRF